MKKSLSLILSFVLFAFLAIPAFAQNNHSVSVKLLDASNGEPVGYATVSVTAKGATTPTKYTLTTDKGAATLDGLKNGTYEFKAEMMGYKVFTQEITIKDANVALGDISMQVDQEVLDAASVTDFGAPVIIKKDTIEYNASAFKTTENDVLEDLLKKLPGVEVNDDGSVTVNGQTITRVYIDGKTFFMDDPQVATKNLPAKIINKVKVVEKKSEQAEFTGIDDGQEETVLDLSVQPGMMHGVIGNVTAGIGHDFPNMKGADAIQNLTQSYDSHRFQDNLFLGNFTDNLQISIIGNANNANAMGFGGGGGGMGMGGGRGMGGGMGGGFGGGMGGGGITTSYMLGGNIGGNLFDDRMELTGNYMFNGNDRDSQSISQDRDKLTQNDVRYDLVKNTQSVSTSHGTGHSVGIRLEHEFSKNTSIIFEPQLSFNNSSSLSTQIFDSSTDRLNGTVEKTNEGFSASPTDTKSVNASGMFMYRQRIVLPGRTLTANIRYNLSNSTSDGLNQSLTNTFFNGKSMASIVNQRNEQTNNNASINLQTTYTEPMGNHFYIEANYNYSWQKQDSEKNVFNSANNDAFSGLDNRVYVREGETYDADYSNRIINESINQTIGLNMLYQSDKLRAQVGASLRPTKTHNETTKSTYQMDTTFTVYNWSPQAMIQWDATDNLNLRFNYRGNSNQPSISQLMPVPDNSNPTRVSLGNPSLAPYFSHNVNGDFRFNNRQKFSSINLRFNGGMTQSPIINALVTTNGVQYSIPFNGPNSYNGNVNLMMNLPVFSQKFTMNANTSASSNISNSFTGNKIDITKYFRDGNVSDFNYPLFLTDYKDIAKSDDFLRNTTTTLNLSERINFTWRGEDFDIRFGGSTNYQKTWVTLKTVEETPANWRNTLNASATWNWDLAGMSFDTDFRYNWYNGFTTKMEPEFLWNMEIEKMVFNQRATLALRAYDILGQTKNFSVTDSSVRHSESLSNSLGRYVIVAFSWRFGTFGGRGGRGGGPRGGGRGGRGGMGGGMPMGGGFPGGGMMF